jgi:hypothetical protein
MTTLTNQALSANDLTVLMSSGIYAHNPELNYKTRLVWMHVSSDTT